MTGLELTIGGVGIATLLSLILNVVFQRFDIPNKNKPWIAIILGTLLGVAAMFTAGGYVGIGVLIDFVVRGFMAGATAVGLYEGFKTHGG